MAMNDIPWGRITAEFVAIVAGVTVALVADDWRDYRNDRQDERIALQEILEDLQTDSLEWAGQFRNMTGDEAAVVRLLRRVEEEIPTDSLWSLTRPLYMYTAYEQVNSGYTGLKDSGRVSIIQNPELRREIVLYFEATQPYLKHFYDEWWRYFRAFQDSSAPYMRVVPGPTGDSLSGNAETHFVRPWREIRQDDRFVFSATQMSLVASVFRNRINSRLQENSELQARIREELS